MISYSRLTVTTIDMVTTELSICLRYGDIDDVKFFKLKAVSAKYGGHMTTLTTSCGKTSSTGSPIN